MKWNDWNLSVGTVRFDAPITYDKDADYALVIPSGCFGAKYRPDITNGELIIKLHSAESGVSEVSAGVATPDVVFNLQGRRVVSPSRGLYIVNGKKIFIKQDALK